MMLLFLTLGRLNVIQRLKLQNCYNSPGILIIVEINLIINPVIWQYFLNLLNETIFCLQIRYRFKKPN